MRTFWVKRNNTHTKKSDKVESTFCKIFVGETKTNSELNYIQFGMESNQGKQLVIPEVTIYSDGNVVFCGNYNMLLSKLSN